MKKKPYDTVRKLEKKAEDAKTEKYVLKLYVTGMPPRSMKAVTNIREICEEHLKDRYELEIVDIFQQPMLAKGEQIIAAPTLIKNSQVHRRHVRRREDSNRTRFKN